LDKAMKAADEAAGMFEKEGDASGQAAVMKTKMNVLLKKNKFYDAIDVAKSVVQLYRESSAEEKLLGDALMELAKVYLQGDSFDEAVDAAGQALAVFTRGKDNDGMKAAGDMLKDLGAEQKKQNMKLVLEMNKSRLGHIPKNLIIAPDGLDIDAFNGFKK